MKKREWIVLPLLSIAVAFFAVLMKLMSGGNCTFAKAWAIAASPLGVSDAATLAVIFIAVPGVITMLFFRKYPERVRLSPISFGMISLIPLSLLSFLPLTVIFCIGNAVIVATTLAMPTFKPGDRLGKFEKIPFRKTVIPALLAALPLLILLSAVFSRC